MDLTTFIGFAAATLTTISFLPQVTKCWKTRQTKAISYPGYFLFGIGIFMWFIYGLLRQDWAIIIANSIVFICIVLILIMKFRFESSK